MDNFTNVRYLTVQNWQHSWQNIFTVQYITKYAIGSKCKRKSFTSSSCARINFTTLRAILSLTVDHLTLWGVHLVQQRLILWSIDARITLLFSYFKLFSCLQYSTMFVLFGSPAISIEEESGQTGRAVVRLEILLWGVKSHCELLELFWVLEVNHEQFSAIVSHCDPCEHIEPLWAMISTVSGWDWLWAVEIDSEPLRPIVSVSDSLKVFEIDYE
jgi:hypothetical protein